MTSRAEARKRSSDDSNNGKLLQDIESISKALYLDRIPSKSSHSTSQNQPKLVEKTNKLEPNSKSKHSSDDPSTKDKKPFWNWKSFKAFSHVRNRKFNCCFTLQVHTIEGLPSKFGGVSLRVHWKRRDGEMVTNPVKIVGGVAEFEEKLTYTCSVYGSRSGPRHSAKYEAKHFLLYAASDGNPSNDLGKHRVDLTRLLPLTLEELEDEKSTSTWTTSFKLSGWAKGAVMNVSFGYMVLGDNVTPAPNNKNVLQLLEPKPKSNLSTVRSLVKPRQGDDKATIDRASSVPTKPESSITSRSMEDIKVLHEVLPMTKTDLCSSVNVLYQKLDEEKLDPSVDDKREIDVFTDHVQPVNLSADSDSLNKNNPDQYQDAGFSVTGREIVLSSKDAIEHCEGTAEVNDERVEVSQDHTCAKETDANPQINECGPVREKLVKSEEEEMCTKESLLEELESALIHVAGLERAGLDTPEAKSDVSGQDNIVDENTNRNGSSHSLDDVVESVADEFLSMLGMEETSFSCGSDAEPESPRERLLREFEKEAEASGYSLFGFDICEEDGAEYEDDAPTVTLSPWDDFDDDFQFLGLDQADDDDEHPIAVHIDNSRPRAKVLEDLETEVLMQEMGLNDKAFEGSPPNSTSGFGSPIDLPPGDLQLPPLGDDLGPLIQTKNGGFLRSMNPALFKDAKSGGSLIMQVSNPIVVPADLGSEVTEILQHLASVGLEKLSMQANKLMPLDDITGKTMQQIAWETAPQLESSERLDSLKQESESPHLPPVGKKKGKRKSSGRRSNNLSSSDNLDSEFASLEDLAPLAMDKIEALSMEGLRIQSGMSDEEAPSNISAKSIGEFSALQGKRENSFGSMELEGAAGLKLLDMKDSNNSDTIDGLMGLSLTLDEWMRIDSGEFDDDDDEQMSERTSKILAAHHATCQDLNFSRGRRERNRGKGSSKRGGLLGNNFTVALMVQLRDPLRNYEPVGTPMLALIQVERVFVPPKPRIYSTVAEVKASDKDEEEEHGSKTEEDALKKEKSEQPIQEDHLIPQYKVSEVHVAGLKSEPGKKKGWGSGAQQQSGSRWLLANGMGKTNKHPFLKTGSKASLGQPGDSLWSVSSRVGSKWKDLSGANSHKRNSDVTFGKGNMKLR